MSHEPQAIQQQGREGKDTSEVGGAGRKYRKGKNGLSKEERIEAKRECDRRNNIRAAEWRRQNPGEAKARDKRYREKTPTYHAEKQRQWRALNHDHSKAYHRAYMNRKSREDINYKIRHSLASRIITAMSRTHNVKSAATAELIGCSIAFLREYIAARFKHGMMWCNYGEWHVDHKIPCAAFDLSDPLQQRQCFNYTNLQPMWAAENLAKKDKIPTFHQPEFL